MTAILLAGLLSSVQPMTLPESPPRAPWTEEKRAETLYLACGAADMASTAFGLHRGLKEANPLARGDSTKEVVLKLAALKLGFYAFAKATKAPPHIYRWTGYLQCGAAAWNTALALSK